MMRSKLSSFFDGFADMAFLLQSELESIRLEYHTKDEELDNEPN